MYHKSKVTRESRDIVILSGNKDSSIVIMNKKDYNRKIDYMINERIQQGIYKYNILNELELFQSFLYRHSFNVVTIDNLKLRQIIDQTRTVIAEYLKPLTKIKLVITNTQQFPSMLNNVPLSKDEEDVSYDLASVFTNISIKVFKNYSLYLR